MDHTQQKQLLLECPIYPFENQSTVVFFMTTTTMAACNMAIDCFGHLYAFLEPRDFSRFYCRSLPGTRVSCSLSGKDKAASPRGYWTKCFEHLPSSSLLSFQWNRQRQDVTIAFFIAVLRQIHSSTSVVFFGFTLMVFTATTRIALS